VGRTQLGDGSRQEGLSGAVWLLWNVSCLSGKIVSGGQTGVDRAALDAALAASFPCGGWCPAGRKAEDGVIPDKYPVVEWPGSGYRPRTLKNVRDSDGTLILYTRVLSTGTKFTRNLCVREKRPILALDASEVAVERAVSAVLQFIAEHSIAVMNVAGPRVSGWPEGYRYALEVVGGVIAGRAADL